AGVRDRSRPQRAARGAHGGADRWTRLHATDPRAAPVRGAVRPALPRLHAHDGRAPDVLRLPDRLRVHPERRDLAAVPPRWGLVRPQAAQVRVDPGGRGQRAVLPGAGRPRQLRLPDLSAPEPGAGDGLLLLAPGGLPPQRPQRALLLAAPSP